jgi:alpha-D-xyloside xylohydrolase
VVARAEEFGDAQAGYERASCHLSFYRGEDLILEEDEVRGAPLKRRARQYLPLGAHHRVTANFSSASTEKLVGMGLYQQENLDLKGTTLELAHRNSQASVPFVVSSAGYGFFWHNPAIGRATFATNRTEWVAESAGQLDYWVTVGNGPAQILEHYAAATGTVPKMPEYGLGYWQCKLRYSNQEELLEVAREHARRQIPLDLIVIDFFHWPHMGDYRYEDEFWPDPEAMAVELEELGIKLMVSVWPQVSLDSENFAELMRKNYLVRSDQGLDVQMYFQGPSRFLDITHPGAREWLWQRLQKNYPGTVSFWLDEAEPEYGLYQYPQYRYHAGQALEVSNIYPQLFSRAVFDGQVRDRPSTDDTGPINLVRCAWAGSQRYGALVWSGDIHSSFEAMRRQVVAGIHMGMAGLPWFTTDIGGFAGGDVTSPDFRELLVRWFQMATFMPVMRMHGDRSPSHEVSATDGTTRNPSGAANEVWSYGEQIEEILVRFIHAREDLRPYTRRIMAEAHETGHAVMRGLFHDFPADPRAWEVTDQFLFGPDLLIAPVAELGARERKVYLPDRGRWIDVASGQVHDGGQEMTVPASLETIPVFVRDGADPADGALEALRGRLSPSSAPA